MATRNYTKVDAWYDPVNQVTRDLTQGVHSNECLSVTIDLSTDASTTVVDGPAILFGIWVSVVLSAHTVGVEDGAATVLTLPASLAAGTQLNCYGRKFDTSLIVNPNDSSTGTIVVFYKPL